MISNEPVGTDRLLGGKGLEGLDFEPDADRRSKEPSTTRDADLRIRGLDLGERPDDGESSSTERAVHSR